MRILHPRVRILQEFDAQRHGDLRAGVNVQHGPDCLPADRFVGVLHQLRQGGDGRLRRRTDLAQRVGRVAPDLRRIIFQQFHQRRHRVGGLLAPRSQFVDRLQLHRLIGRLQVADERCHRILAGRGGQAAEREEPAYCSQQD